MKEILGLDVIGVIPESPDVLSASNAGTPVILNEQSDVSSAYEDAVGRLLGDTPAVAVPRRTQEGLPGPHVRRLRMGLLAFFRRSQPTANVAKERLRIIVAQERTARGAVRITADAAT